MIGFKYSLTTVYSGDWDEVTLNARGIVFNEETGEIIARPFKKFFNFQEFSVDGTHSALYEKVPAEFKPNLEGPFRVMEKADGSLGIMFWTGAQWYVKTGGAFTSDQAIWANKWVTKNMNVTLLDKSKTYCFEIIYPEDIHPVKYDFEGLVLLSVLDNQSGEEESLDYIKNVAEELKVSITTVMRIFDLVKYSVNDIGEYICIDEFKGNLGDYKYQAVMIDPQNSKVVNIFKNRFKHDLSKEFSTISKERRYKVKFFICDM